MKRVLAVMRLSSGRSDGARDLKFTTFDVPGSLRTRLFSLNDCGQIVGDYSDAAGHNHGLLLNGGVAINIDVPGATSTTIHGINNEGSLVGCWIDSAGAFHGFVDDDGRITTIDAPGAAGFSRLLGINSAATMVGDFIDSENVQHGFILTRGAFAEFDFPGAHDTSPAALNADGVIVGGYTGAGPSGVRGFIFSCHALETIDLPGIVNAQPLGINARGDLVGTYDNAAGHTHAFARIGGRYYTFHVPESSFTTACGINSSGHIVGNFNLGSTHGFIAAPAAGRLVRDRKFNAARWFFIRRRHSLRIPAAKEKHMKWAKLLVALLLVLFWTGCAPVGSVYPFFEEQDKLMEAGLLGQWTSKTDSLQMTFAREDPHATEYRVQLIGSDDVPGEDAPRQTRARFKANLFRVGSHLFLDLEQEGIEFKWKDRSLSRTSDDLGFYLSVHTVYRVDLEADVMRLAYLDDNAVASFINARKFNDAGFYDPKSLLLVPTRELQTQLLAHAEDGKLLSEDIIFERDK